MKLKQITLHDALQSAGVDNVYIMIRMTDSTPVEQLKQADGYFIEEEEHPAPVPPAQVEPIHPAGAFTWEDRWAEETEPAKEEKPKTKSKIDSGKICALRRANWSVAKIADEIGCSEQTVRNILKREGMV